MPQSYKWANFGIGSRVNYQASYFAGAGLSFASFDYDNIGLYLGAIPEGVPMSSPRPYYLALRREHCDDFLDGRIHTGWVQDAGIGGGIIEAGNVVYSDRDGNYTKQSLGLLFDPMSTGYSYDNVYQSTFVMRNAVGAGDFALWARMSARELPTLQADVDYWTAGIQFWFNTDYAGGNWTTRLEVGVCHDSAAGGRRMWFCETHSAGGAGVSSFQYGPLLGNDDYPVEVGITRVNTTTSPEFQMWYRICSGTGWGDWTEFTGFNPEDSWGYADLAEANIWIGCFGYTWGLAGRQVVFDDFAYGPSIGVPAGYWTSTRSEIEWEAIDSENVRTRWALDQFETWEENEGDSDVEFQYSITNDGVPAWSGWLNAEGMALETPAEGRYFHLKARLCSSTDYQGTPKLWLINLIYSLGPLVSFEASPTEGDAPPLTVYFTPQFYNTPVEGLEWDFGDESSPSGDFAPEHDYIESGKFSPKLTAWNEEGVTEYQRTDLIDIGVQPYSLNIDFEASPTEGYAPLLVRFHDRSSKTTQQWLWNFGDGRNSQLANPTHVYANEGSYDVDYTAWDMDGGHDTTSKLSYIMVTSRPELPYPDFSWESSPPSDGGAAPYIVNFADQSTGSPTAWSWDFGDESSPVTTQNPSHTYSSEGVFDVTLTVSNANGSNGYTWEGLITVVNIPPNLNPDFSHGHSIWHMQAGQEYLSGNWSILQSVENMEFTMLRSGGCGPGRMVLARDWAERSEINVGDSVAVLNHKKSQPYQGDMGLACWYLGYVEEIKADLGKGTVEYILTGYARWLSDIYPGGNDDADAPISYRSSIRYSQSYGPDPNDPDCLQLHYDMTECKISDIVQDLYARYAATLTTSGGTAVFPVGPDIDETPGETDISFLKLDGSQNLADVLDTLAALAGNWTWGVDVEEYWENVTGNEGIGYVYPRFFFKSPSTVSESGVQIGDRVKRCDEVKSKRFLYNELVIEGGYKFNSMPYVVPMNYTLRHEGSIGRWGRRRLSIAVPQIKTRGQAEAYANKFFSEYARPRTFLSLQQIGSNKRLAPFRRFFPFCSDPELFEPRGGLLTLKDKQGNVSGIYDFDEARCVFNDAAIWEVSVGPRDPKARAGVAGAGLPRAFFGTGRAAERPRKTQESVTQRDMTYAPVFLGYARIVKVNYDPELKDFLYDIVPTKDPRMQPATNAQVIEGAYNIYSTLIVADMTYTQCARPIARDTQVAYYRGWSSEGGGPYYYLAEVTPRLTSFDIAFGEPGLLRSNHTYTVDIPGESCLYKPLKEYHSAPSIHIDSSSAWANDWNFCVDWNYETPRMYIRGVTKDGLPHPTHFPLHVWVQIVSVKRSDI